MASTVFLSLGSNLGDREANLRTAVAELGASLELSRISSWYETDPVGVGEQPSFLNLAIEARTDLTPYELLVLLKKIEYRVGRRPTFRWGPRVVDIDILLYDDLQLETSDLTIPHREMIRRAFVLAPLTEIAAETDIPGRGESVASALNRLQSGADSVRRLQPFEHSDIYTGQ